MAEHNTSKWHLLRSLKTIIKKVTFLVNSNFTFTGGGVRRRLSFGERFGLTAIMSSSDDDDDDDDNNNDNLEFCDSGSSSHKLKATKSFRVERTKSFREEDDIDKRAEMFIENFYRQLRYERQVSLQVRYMRETSFGSSDSNSCSP
ncbi:hypothetical protein HanXRQr2_Chr09g0372091 [Helianthus annuus]|uniref:Cotton fiber protein n=1 Tax=Helianthus annuus TaxID=4232 RepID=A0A9K3I3T5_HELAN|nr:hypothetical protein HanXRQr2_Chr09g0372091 [Helianthus annuus]KAJ0532833.1 hypothetical protein HanIR_Chr09g0401411 [Helianthus annuus]KAJ0891822.1 hypothetical protein HanPSC8_Chr09g0358651 [Helianthus annuus]